MVAAPVVSTLWGEQRMHLLFGVTPPAAMSGISRQRRREGEGGEKKSSVGLIEKRD